MHDTPRLLLRPFEPADAEALFALMTDPDWLRFIGDRGVHSVADARRRIEERFRPDLLANGFGFLAVIDRATGAFAGMCGLIRRHGLPGIDLGYALLPAWRGRGYVREAASAMLAHAGDALGIATVYAIVLPGNDRSVAVLDQLGFRRSGQVRLPGETTDLDLYRRDAVPPVSGDSVPTRRNGPAID